MDTVEVEKGSRHLAALGRAVAVVILAVLFTGGVSRVSAITGTTTTVMSSLNPAAAGQVVQFTASVTPAGPGTPTGTVTFTADGFFNLGTAVLSGGVASITSAALSVGSHSIVATYSGDANFTTSQGSMVETIVGGACTPGFNCGSGFGFGCIPGVNCGFGFGFGCAAGAGNVVFIPGVGFVPVNAPGLGFPAGSCNSTSQNCQDNGFGFIICTPTTTPTSSTGTSSVPVGVTVQVLSGGGSEGLNPGCNQVTVLTAPGTPTSTLAFRVSGSQVVAIWHFDNATKMYDAAYFGTSGAPVDITATGGGPESYYVCVTQYATITSG